MCRMICKRIIESINSSSLFLPWTPPIQFNLICWTKYFISHVYCWSCRTTQLLNHIFIYLYCIFHIIYTRWWESSRIHKSLHKLHLTIVWDWDEWKKHGKIFHGTWTIQSAWKYWCTLQRFFMRHLISRSYKSKVDAFIHNVCYHFVKTKLSICKNLWRRN